MATIDREEIETLVRFYLGDVGEDILSSATLQFIIENGVSIYGDDDAYKCEITYYSVIESLRFLIRKNVSDSSSGGGSGSVSKREEKIGKREIKVTYDTTSISANSWDDLLEEYLRDPSLICKSLARETSGLVIIGGVDQKEYERVEEDSNVRSPYHVNVQRKYDSNLSWYQRYPRNSGKYRN